MDWQDAERSFEHPALGDDTIPEAFARSAARNAAGAAQRYKGGVYDRSLADAGAVPAAPDGDYAALTYAEMRDVVAALAAGFRDLGVEPGTRVAVFAHTRMEWAQADLAVLAAGGVVTTVYPSSSRDQLAYLLEDPGATVVVAENADLVAETLAVADELPQDLEAVVSMDAPSGDPGGDDGPPVHTLGEVYERGAGVETGVDDPGAAPWLADRDPEALASVIYTSGTTGPPKGVRLSHANFRANVDQVFRRLGPRPDRDPDAPVVDTDTTTLSFLPLAHVFERCVGSFIPLIVGATVAYAESPDTLRSDLNLVQPSIMTGVPRVYEKLYAAIREGAAESPVKARLFEWATDVGRAHYEADDPGPLLELQRAVADRLVFSTIREAVGGEIGFFIAGGGSLAADLCATFHGMGLPVLEGYGLTETSPVVTVNPIERPVAGTIGPPVADTEVALDETVVGDELRSADAAVGELLVRGPQVFEGYLDRPEATAEAFVDEVPTAGGDADDADGSGGDGAASDGADAAAADGADDADPWFRTGDIVERRSDGYVAFRERAKQLLVLSTGKNVAPGPIEDAFAANEFVEQCLVLGDGRKFVSALLVPDFDRLRAWADREGVDLPDDRETVCRDGRVRERIGTEVEAVNERFEDYERIKRFRLVPEEFTEENDLLTPTMKKKRRNVLERFGDEVALIYEASED